MTGRPGPRRLPSGKTERKVTGGKGDTEAKARKNAERAVMDADRITCCNQCKQPLIEIDNRVERLKGCLTCNLWSTVDRKLLEAAVERRPPCAPRASATSVIQIRMPGARRPKQASHGTVEPRQERT
jgi:hypothetical protein